MAYFVLQEMSGAPDTTIVIWRICVTGDVGGSLGLFLGASVLTIVELFDALLHHGLKRLCVRS